MLFHGLPTDLQIHIVHNWLAGDERDLLQVLSRLICSSSKAWEDLLSLTRHKPHFAATVDVNPAKRLAFKDLPGMLRWLQRWAVPIKVLDLTDLALPCASISNKQLKKLPIRLTNVDTIYFPAKPHSAGWILPLVPNLTTIRVYGSSDTLWPVLQKLPTLQLKKLSIVCWDERAVNALLQTFGRHIQELHLDWESCGKDTTQMIVKNCPHLSVLQFTTYTTSRILQLLVGCPALTDLSLTFTLCTTCTEADLKTILANRQLKRLILTNYFNVHFKYACVGGIIAEHKWLDIFQLGRDCAYDRSKGYLQIETHLFSLSALRSVLQACRPLHKLKLMIASCEFQQEDTLVIASQAMSESMREVELEALVAGHMTAERLLSIPLRCPQLRKLVVNAHCYSLLSDASLHALAAACPFLHHLSFEGVSACTPSFTDDGVRALFQGCPDLQVLRIDMATALTFRTLQAIVDWRVRLKSLTVFLNKLTEVEFLLFRQLVKDAGLLPVVEITRLRHQMNW